MYNHSPPSVVSSYSSTPRAGYRPQTPARHGAQLPDTPPTSPTYQKSVHVKFHLSRTARVSVTNNRAVFKTFTPGISFHTVTSEHPDSDGNTTTAILLCEGKGTIWSYTNHAIEGYPLPDAPPGRPTIELEEVYYSRFAARSVLSPSWVSTNGKFRMHRANGKGEYVLEFMVRKPRSDDNDEDNDGNGQSTLEPYVLHRPVLKATGWAFTARVRPKHVGVPAELVHSDERLPAGQWAVCALADGTVSEPLSEKRMVQLGLPVDAVRAGRAAIESGGADGGGKFGTGKFGTPPTDAGFVRQIVEIVQSDNFAEQYKRQSSV